ncbi:hypothetical protein ACIBO2_21170 [Nonomuraea sp. NPDC050022]|uniref:hypothetical protein n=1 Tax=unclassified Nonomuraea TaxID=2593643 RepID=UPI0033FF2855
MSILTATAICTAHGAIVDSTGQVVAQRLLAQRVSWLTALTAGLTDDLVTTRWTAADLQALAAGVGLDGRALPAKGWMAVRRLGWGLAPTPGLQVCDRVLRCAQEQAGRTLRLALYRRALVQAIVATWPQDPRARTDAEWEALRALLPKAVGVAEIRNRTRQIRASLDEQGVLRADLTDLEQAPASAAQIVLAAADRQLLTLERTGERGARLRVKLPLVASPTRRADWAWHVLPIALPPTVAAQAKLCAPTLRVHKGRVRVDLPFQTPIAFAPATGHVRGCGFDWGVNKLLTGVTGSLADGADGQVISDGRPLTYDASGVSAKLGRLRAEREYLATKRAHQQRLLAGITPADSRFTELDTAHEVICATRAARRARRTQTDLHPRPAARDRSKNRPTPKRPTRPTRASKTSSRVPDRRTVPPHSPQGTDSVRRAMHPSRDGTRRTGQGMSGTHHRTGFHHAKTTPVLALTAHRGGPSQATPTRLT